MQELIEDIQDTNPEYYEKNYNWLHNLLEKEKQQIIEFGYKMQLVSDVDTDGNIKFTFNPEDYYSKTFEQ